MLAKKYLHKPSMQIWTSQGYFGVPGRVKLRRNLNVRYLTQKALMTDFMEIPLFPTIEVTYNGSEDLLWLVRNALTADVSVDANDLAQFENDVQHFPGTESDKAMTVAMKWVTVL